MIGSQQWGSALMYFTGSKEHNISLRRLAIERGWKLSEYGLFKDDKILASKTEEEIYKKLSVPFIEPRNRVAELATYPQKKWHPKLNGTVACPCWLGILTRIRTYTLPSWAQA